MRTEEPRASEVVYSASMRRTAVLLALSLVAPAAFAQDLFPGAKAPSLDIGGWLKGGWEGGLKPGKTYVVEFWATWCGPCIAAFPHMSELAKKYEGQVEFVGVNIWERGKPIPEVQEFVNGQGAKMGYNVAYDNGEAMTKSWMQAAKQNGIPASFVVKDGVIQWIGHPMSLDEPLEQLAAGKLDIGANQAAFKKEVAEDEARMAESKQVADTIKAATVQYEGGDKAGAIAKLDQLEKEKPNTKLQVASAKLNLYAKHDTPAAEALIAKIAAGKEPEWRFLAQFAMGTVKATTPEGKEIGAKAIKAAVEASADGDILVCYFASLYYRDTGNKEEGLKCVDRALALLPSSEYKGNASLENALKDLKKELTGQATA